MTIHNEALNELKNLNIKINQIIPFYDFIEDYNNFRYFEDVKKEIETKKIIEKEPELPIMEEEKLEEKLEGNDNDKAEEKEDISNSYISEESEEESEDKDSKYI